MALQVKLYFDVAGEHTTTKIYAGPPGGTLALAGRFTMLREEWTEFAAALCLGAAKVGVSVEVVPEPVAGVPKAGVGHG